MNEQHDSLTDTILTIAEHLERSIDANGWDQPATLWEISITDQTVPQHVLDEVSQGGVAVGFEATFVDILEGHPYTALIGRHISDDALGVALASEGWNYSATSRAMAELGPLSYAPSEDPDRVEIRIVTVMLRDGTTVAVVRERGQDHSTTATSNNPGRAEAALRRYLHLPSGLEIAEPAAVLIPRAFAQAALNFIVRAATNEHAIETLRTSFEQTVATLDNADDRAEALETLNDPEAMRALAVNTAWFSLLDMPASILAGNTPPELAELFTHLPAGTVNDTIDHLLSDQYTYPTWDELANVNSSSRQGWFDAPLLANHIAATVANIDGINTIIDAVEDIGLLADTAATLRSVAASC